MPVGRVNAKRLLRVRRLCGNDVTSPCLSPLAAADRWRRQSTRGRWIVEAPCEAAGTRLRHRAPSPPVPPGAPLGKFTLILQCLRERANRIRQRRIQRCTATRQALSRQSGSWLRRESPCRIVERPEIATRRIAACAGHQRCSAARASVRDPDGAVIDVLAPA